MDQNEIDAFGAFIARNATPMTHNPKPDVTQADREAAADAYANFLTAIRGEEGGSSLAEAFARHRQATEARMTAAVEALRQYRDDMRYPPSADSRERRIEMIEAILKTIGEK